MKPNLFREFVTALLCGLLLLQSVQAAAPGWWSAQGVIAPNKPADDYAALNQGQLKLLASKAWLQMELSLPGGAGPELTQLVSGWRLSRPQTDDFAVVNVGQLKTVAKPFYERLAGAGLLALPGWIGQAGAANADDFGVVNLGQAKLIFSFALPQAINAAPQRLSGNGMAGLGSLALPAGHQWGSGRPPFSAEAGLTPPGVLPGTDAEVSTSPSSAADWSKVAAPTGLTIESKWAGGSVLKVVKHLLNPDGTVQRDPAGKAIRDGWAWSGAAYGVPGDDYQDDLSSAGALTNALLSMSTLPAGTEPPDQTEASTWTTNDAFGAVSLPFLGSLASGYEKFTAPEGTDEEGEEVGEFWYGQQTQFRVSGGGATADRPRDAWWKIERTLLEQGEIIGHTVEFVPYVIAATREQAGVMSIDSQHWGASMQHETVHVGLILPQMLQVNDGDADGDEVPDYADGFGADYIAPEEPPELPETADLPWLGVGSDLSNPAARLRFSYAASDPAGVVVTTGANGEKSYQPAPGGGLRLWCSEISAATHYRLGYRESRDPRSVTMGGDYIPPGAWVDVAAIKASHDNALLLYCESVAPSEHMYDQTVTVEVDEDGDGPEPAYIATKHFFTSVGSYLERVENGQIGARDNRMQPSLPNPTIDLQNVSVTNARVADDGSGLLVDVAFSGKVHSAVCDLTPGEETGSIQHAYASVNSEPLPQSVVTLEVTKEDTPDGQDRPYPYEGTFSHTLTGVKVTEGKNTLGLIVSDPLYHLSGTAEVGFEINATPPAAFASSTEVLLELPVAGGTLAADEARLSITVDDAALLENRVLKRQAGGLLYRSVDGQAALQFTQVPSLTATAPEALHGYITLPQSGWQGAAFSPMTETDVASGVFSWSAAEQYAGYWGWSVSVGEVGAALATGPGEFHAYTVRLMGPAELLAQVRRIHLGGTALPVLIQNGIARLADALRPDQPVTIAALPIEARQPPPPTEDDENETSPGLAELGIGESWEEQDLPETFYQNEGYWGAKGRKAVVPENGITLMGRIQRQAGIWWDDHTDTGYYKGFVTGFFDNPYTTGKDAVTSLVGISEKAANVLWLTSPLGTVWEFTFGDAYQGEIQTAIRAGQRAKEIGAQAYQVLKEWGPEVWDFLWKLNFQANETVVRSALLGEFPSKEKMGPELRLALELLEQILIMADDAWVDMGAYQRGYWQGYITFEIVAVVVMTALTAEAGGVGGAAALARHAPKVTRLYTFLDKLLDRLSDIPQLGKLVTKIRLYITGMKAAGAFCFVAGTQVLTLRGQIPIEQVKAGDYVWSRDDETGKWGWRPVLKTFVTHPDTLVHVRYELAGGALDEAAGNGLGLARQAVPITSGESEIVGTKGHPFHVRRAGMAAAFLAASALQADDLLTLADGRDAIVNSVRVEHAAEGELFTTYNFTVADHHTYFAGTLPVWVHNTGLDACSFLENQVARILSTRNPPLTWDTSAGMRVDILAQEMGGIIKDLKQRGKPLPDRLLRLAFAKICQAEYKDFGPGRKHTNLNAFKSVKWWDDFFEEHGIRKGSVPITDGVSRTKLQWHIHHLVEDWMLKRLGTSPPGQKRMDVPGVVMRGYDNGQPGLGPFHNQKDTGISVVLGKLRRKNLSEAQMLQEFKVILTSPEFKDMNLWPAAREFLLKDLPQAKHSLIPPL